MDPRAARLGVPPLFTYEAISFVLEELPPTDESALRNDLGVAELPIESSFRDTIRWMVDAGHVRPAQAGALAD